MARLSVSLAFVLLIALGSAESAGAAGPWRELHRPVELPAIAPGEACPVSPIDQRVDWDSADIFGGSGIGRGPAYPGLGGSDPPGHFPTNSGPHGDDGLFGGKLFWYVKPSYRGRVLIRGRRLDGSSPLRFNRPNSPELRISPGETVTWRGQPSGSRGVPSGVYIGATGCYGVQIDGATFSRTVIFTASTP